ncbi:MAG TPA: hypothetical protein VHC90_09590 [Bryobacteraceae bacterium]|nr:hypothetical protein [Bryobacteraceae bacterium]
MSAAAGARSRSGVLTLPRFEDYGERICEWLSALSPESPARRAVLRVVREIRQVEAKAGRVRNSVRHENLAVFLEHAAHSLECGELPGARYILMMAHALLSARTTKDGNRGEAGIVLQLPARSEATAAADAATGIVAG